MANKKSDIKLYSGLRFGKMTIVDRDDEESENVPCRSYEIFVVKCDCGKVKSMKSNTIRKSIRKGTDSNCGMCVSFYDWCIDNDREDILYLWDYEMNKCTPKEVSYGSGLRYYFKCKNNNKKHKSEQHRLDKITSKYKSNNIRCIQCESIGQYIIDFYGEHMLCKMWSTNNIVNPFLIFKNSKTKIKIICQECKNEKAIVSSNFVWQGLCCSCGDGISYPNKFMTALLKQLKTEFEQEKVFIWSDKKKYDHYISSANCIIENHGEQHYYGWCGNEENLQMQQDNDKLKKDMALTNGVEHYIVLDCRKSDMEWIKSYVMNSGLPELLGFSENDIDWMECDRYGLKNLIKETGLLWMTRDFESTTELGKYMGINKNMICKYLQKAARVGWCDYDPKVEKSKASSKNGKATGVPIYIVFDGNNIIFESSSECARQSMAMFGVKLNQSDISKACRINNIYKGFTFGYADSLKQN